MRWPVVPLICAGQGYQLTLGCEGMPKLLAGLPARKRGIADVDEASASGACATSRAALIRRSLGQQAFAAVCGYGWGAYVLRSVGKRAVGTGKRCGPVVLEHCVRVAPWCDTTCAWLRAE